MRSKMQQVDKREETGDCAKVSTGRTVANNAQREDVKPRACGQVV